MSGLPGKGKQAPKGPKPSRLRHEVRPESTDDERDGKKPIIQEPLSDSIVPETQPDHNGYFIRDDNGPDHEPDLSNLPTSPSATAFLERTTVTKKAEVSERVALAFKPLSRESLAVKNDSVSATLVPSAPSRSQIRKAPKKTHPRDEPTSNESITHAAVKTPDAQEEDLQTSHGKQICRLN